MKKGTRNNRGWAIIILMLAIALQAQAQNLINLKLENKLHSRPLLEERIYFRMNRAASVEDVLGVLNDMGIAKFELTSKKIVVANK